MSSYLLWRQVPKRIFQKRNSDGFEKKLMPIIGDWFQKTRMLRKH